jgi:arylsulfatase A-like enzyme
MTGRYSTRTGVWHTVMGRHMPRAGEVLMPQIFADSGYRTAIFGKWHLGDNFPFRPQDRGFHEVLVHGGGGVGQIPDFWDNDYFDDTYFRHRAPNGHPPETENASSHAQPPRGCWAPFEGYCTDVFFTEAIRFIARNKERPFFLYLSTNAPHSPFRVPEEYTKPYEDCVSGDVNLARFYGMIANIDENVGRLLDHLDQWQLTANTILIFMTDNGTSRGATFPDNRGNDGKLRSGYNAGMRGRKGSPYEGGHRVPCFVRWPAKGLGGGRDIDRLTAHVDLLPTLIELCGLQAPKGVAFDGISLVPLLTTSGRDWPQRTLFAHHQELPRPEKYRFGCVMNGRWRLIMRSDLSPQPRFELFDMAVDPGQASDVSRQNARVVERLRNAYEAWWSQLAEQFDQYSEIVVGDRRQNPVLLTCFEWHSSRRWWQPDIRRGFMDNGFWALRVAQAGQYTITLRRWPEEIDKPITAPIAGGKAIAAHTARIRIRTVEATRKIDHGATSVTFHVSLQPGSTRLQTWFLGDGDESRGAYYARVERTGPR